MGTLKKVAPKANFLQELNSAQRQAAEAGDGPTLIIAGPGTGKTKTLTARIAYLLEGQKAKPNEIIALTFTNKAAREMRERLQKLIGHGKGLPKICTFHALGMELLKQNGDTQKVLSERRRTEIIREISKPAAFKSVPVRELGLLISRAKTSLTSFPRRRESSKKVVASGDSSSDWIPGQARDDGYDKALAQLLQQYEAALVEQGLHDFDDLLTKSFELLRSDEAKRPRYKHVLVDEFQDTNELQYEILKLLAEGAEPSYLSAAWDGNRASERRRTSGTVSTEAQVYAQDVPSTKVLRNVFVIGDPNQSIYAFRGAGTEMFEKFRADFPGLQAVDLTINYRSCPEIIRLANHIFPDSPQLQAFQKEQGSARAIQTLDAYTEAVYVINEIEKGIGGSDLLKAAGHHDVREPRDYAVLYRTHRAAKAVQKAFADSGMPFQIAGEGSPYERPGIQAIIEIMKYLLEPTETHRQDLAKLPTLKRPSLAQLDALLAKLPTLSGTTVCDLAASIATTFSLPNDQNLQQFLSSLVQFGACDNGLQAALQHIDEISQSEFYDPSVNAVTLLTIHASKGLEFANVFLVAAEEGILPKTNQANIDEERRLFYVAVTRAKENLEILHVKTRAGQPAKPSRFITEIPEKTLTQNLDPDMQALERKARKRAAKRAQTTLF